MQNKKQTNYANFLYSPFHDSHLLDSNGIFVINIPSARLGVYSDT